MSELVQLQDNIIDALAAYASELKAVRAHEGRFTEASVNRIMTQSDSAHVAILSLGKGQPQADGTLEHDVTIAIYLVTKETSRKSKGNAALGFAEAIAKWAYRKTFDLECVYPAAPAQARSLASNGLASNATTLWVVEWVQRVRLDGTPPTDPAGQLPAAFYLGRAPEIGADHVDDYDLVTEQAA